MLDKKGFTLIEVIVALVILATLAAIAIPNYINYVQQGAAKSAQSNLISIYNAEKSYYFNNNSTYCTNSCDNNADINANLNLNISDNYSTYSCVTPVTGTLQCVATTTSIAGFSLTLTLTNPVVLLGGTNCATTSGAGCNPVCSPAASIYCPG